MSGNLITDLATDKKNSHMSWDVKTFFSHSGMYGAYTEINQLMVRDGHVSLNTVNEIPDILPSTGIPVFDTRRDKTWKAELDEYLAQRKKKYQRNL